MFIENYKEFNLTHIFECGQCFRWNAIEDEKYIGVVDDYVVTAENTGNGVQINCDDDLFVKTYFDLERNYTQIKSGFENDEIFEKAYKYGYGIRLLKQQPWETMVSFIISANNNIPRIKKIIESLCQNFGDEIIFENKIYYKFPSFDVLSQLTEDDLAVIKSGFRAKYIIDAAKKVSTGEIDLNRIYTLDSKTAREYLKKVKGIGDKVADCILLFAYQKFDVFPKDVWIKRILQNLYHIENSDFDSFISKKFGDFGGIAQQYLFYYGREFI